MNRLLKIGIGVGLVFGAVKLFRMKKVSDKMVSNLSNPRIHKVDLSGIVFRTEIKIQNPTRNSMTITKPVVTLSTNGKYITSNSPEQKSFTIQALTTTNIDTAIFPPLQHKTLTLLSQPFRWEGLPFLPMRHGMYNWATF